MADEKSTAVILVTGSRNWTDSAKIREKLDFATQEMTEQDILLVQGGCRGADTLAKNIALEKGWKVHTEPALWSVHKRAAGPIRNQKMIQDFQPHYAFAFVMPGSKGTLGCIELLKVYQNQAQSRLRLLDITSL
jgi:hypothetical protein